MTLPADLDLDCFRGDTFEYAFTGLDFTDYEKVYFTVKENYRDLDSEAIIQISSASGLVILNGASGSVSGSSSASITIDSGSTVATVHIKASVTDELEYNVDNYFYDLQMVKSDEEVETLEAGVFTLVRDVTRTIT